MHGFPAFKALVRRTALSAIAVCLSLPALSSVEGSPASAQDQQISTILQDSDRFVTQSVSVVGQFRGQNLFRDLGDAPSDDPDAFVLRASNAAIWVMGLRARGKGFALDPMNRADTGHWVRVTGTVSGRPGRVWIRGQQIEMVASPAAALVQIPEARQPDPLEVVFSAPVAGETDVRLTARIRIQLSDDVETATLKDRIRLTYAKVDSVERGEPQPPAIAFAMNYAVDMRAIEIVPSAPLERFREVTIELLDGIRSKRGGALAPWRLTFNTGGS